MAVCGRMKSFRGVCRTINKDFFDGVGGHRSPGGLSAKMILSSTSRGAVRSLRINALLEHHSPNSTLVNQPVLRP